MIAGIDPGMSGAIAILKPDGSSTVHDMPTKKVGKKNKLDGLKIREILQDVEFVMLEEVGSRTGQGIVSAFTFGEGFGLLKGVIESQSLSYATVRPTEWQKRFGLNTGTKDKKKKKLEIANKCLSIFPDANLYGARGGLKDGRSDALMIAHYASQTQLSTKAA
jgi:crossover junction endodeoxyribonuclease RuvC